MRCRAMVMFAVGCLGVAQVAASEPGRRSWYLESETALVSAPVTTYAKETGLKPEEARLALAREELAAPQVAALRAEFSDRLAGVFWERMPVQRVVVRLVGDVQVGGREIATEVGVVPVFFVTGAEATVAALGDRLRVVGPELAKLVPGLTGAWVDETTGRIVLDVGGSGVSRPDYEGEREAVEKVVGVPVEFRFGVSPRDLL